MSRRPSRRNNSRKNMRTAHSQPQSAGKLLFPRHILTLTLLALLIFGMVSFTFAYISNNVLDEPEDGSVMMSVRTALAAQDNEDIGPIEANSDASVDASESFVSKAASDLAEVGANADLAETGYDALNIYGYLYFVKPSDWTNVSFLAGRNHDSWYSTGYNCTNVSGTNLYYIKVDTSNYSASNSTEYASQYAFIDAKDWGGEAHSVDQRYTSAAHYSAVETSYDLNDGSSYYITASNTNNTALSITYLSNGYSDLNKKLTVKTMLSTNGGSSYAETTTNCGTFSASSAKKINGNGSSASSSFSQSNGTGELTTARTNTATISQSPADGYTFRGWKTAKDTTGSGLSTGTYSHTNSGSAVTIYAYYETLPDVAASVSLSANKTDHVYTGITAVTYTATPTGLVGNNVKYNFKVGGTSVQNTSSNTYTRTYSSSGTYSVTVTVSQSGYKSVTSSAVSTTAYKPVINTFTMSPSSLAVNGTGTLASTKSSANGGETVSYAIKTQSPTSGSGNTITLSGTTVTAVQPGTAVLKATMDGAADKELTITVNEPSITPDSAISLYIDETSGTSGAVTSSPTGTGVVYGSSDEDVFEVTSLGAVTPVSLGTANLEITFTYNGSYSKTFTRAVTVKARDIYVRGLESDYNWNIEDNNKMTYNETTGKYELIRWLFREQTTYGGSTQSSPTGSAFLINIGTSTGSPNEYGYVNGYTINGMEYNNITLSNGNNYKSVCLKTKDMTSLISSGNKASYKFVFDYDTKVITVNYPMKVVFDKQGHGADTASRSVFYGETTAEPTLSETGWVFGGWYTTAACTAGTEFDFSNAITDDKNLYAKWTALKTTVTLDKNKAAAAAGTTSVEATYDSDMPAITRPTCTGYTFQGYFDDAVNGTKYYNADGTSAKKWDKTDSTCTLYAHWTANTTTLSFDLAGGSGTNPGSKTATYDAALPAYGQSAPTKTGYTFRGFYDSESTPKQYYRPNASNPSVVESAVSAWDKEVNTYTLTAYWTINQYKVTFSPQYRSGSQDSYLNFTLIPADSLSLNTTDLPSGGNYYDSFDYNSSVTLTAAEHVTDSNGKTYTLLGIFNSSGTKVGTTTYTIAHLGANNVEYTARYTRDLTVELSWDATKYQSGQPTTMSTMSFSAAADGGVSDPPTFEYYYTRKDPTANNFDPANDWTSLTGDNLTAFHPSFHGDYWFRVVATDALSNIAEDIEYVEVVADATTYAITIVQSGEAGTISLDKKVEGTTSAITGSPLEVNGGAELRMSLERPSNGAHQKTDYYISSILVEMESPAGSGTYIELYSAEDINGDIGLQSKIQLSSNVTGQIRITTTIALKPCITIAQAANATHSMPYYKDGVLQSGSNAASANGSYYVDYGSNVTYTAASTSGYYISMLTDSGSGTVSFNSDRTSGTIAVSAIDSDHTFTVTILGNRTVTVAQAAGSPGGASLTVNNTGGTFGQPVSVGYNTPVEIAITPPGGYYVASVTETTSSGATYTLPSADSGTYTVDDLVVLNNSVIFEVTYAANPTVHLVQPQYGSIYITSEDPTDDTKSIYYFDGDSVEYNTELTVHINANSDNLYDTSNKFFTVNSYTYTVGGVDTTVSGPHASPWKPTYSITADTTFSTDITYALSSLPAVTTHRRRIFFTDNKGWSGSAHTDPVYVHYNMNNNTDYSIGTSSTNLSNNVLMSYAYTNGTSYGNMPVLYADIPQHCTHVFFFKGAVGGSADPSLYMDTTTVVPTVYTEYAAISETFNGFYTDYSDNTEVPYTVNGDGGWQCSYDDFRTVGSAGSTGDKMQKTTSYRKAAVFDVSCDFGDHPLAIDTANSDGCTCTLSYSSGKLSLTPTTTNANYALVRVYSKSSGNAKYYLIRVNNFHFYSIEAPQKLFSTSNEGFTQILLQTVVSAATAPTYTYYYSKSNNKADNAYTVITGAPASSTDDDDYHPSGDGVFSGIAYRLRNSYLTYVNQYLGVTYFKVNASSGGDSDERVTKTVVDLDFSAGDRVMYFNFNYTNSELFSLADYKLVARFTTLNGAETGYRFFTMNQMTEGVNRFRTIVPKNAISVTFYLMYPECSPENYGSVDDVYNDYSYVYYYSKTDDYSIGDDSIVFEVSSISDTAIEGEFTGL